MVSLSRFIIILACLSKLIRDDRARVSLHNSDNRLSDYKTTREIPH